MAIDSKPPMPIPIASRPHFGGAPAPLFKVGEVANPEGRRVEKWKTTITGCLRRKLASWDHKQRKTVAMALSDRLVQCGLNPQALDKVAFQAICAIIDYTEGKPKQQIDVNDITAQVADRTDTDLAFYIEHGHWPEEQINRA